VVRTAIMTVPAAIRRELARLAGSKRTRRAEWSSEAPAVWWPNRVLHPCSGTYFTDAGAWEFIVELIEAGHPITQVTLSHPPGKVGYVLIVRNNKGDRDIYIKLQLGSGCIYGRSFHLSRHPRLGT
jgi:hypothetical protein